MLSQLYLQHAIFRTSNLDFHPKLLQKNLSPLYWNNHGGEVGWFIGSFGNEELENEDRSTKHPNLENEAPKSRKRSTQISKTEHPRLENGAPKTRKRSTQNSKPFCSLKKRDSPWSSYQQQESSTITNRMQFKTATI